MALLAILEAQQDVSRPISDSSRGFDENYCDKTAQFEVASQVIPYEL